MKVAVIGASGNAGSQIVAELSRRGHQVTGVARNPDGIAALPGVTAKAGDVNDAAGLAKVIAGHDAVVSSVHFTGGAPERLVAAVRTSGVKRYFVVGGAGSLLVAPGVRVLDTPDFPEAYRVEATAGAAFLDFLKTVDDLDWTYLSPPAMFVPGERTGVFRLGLDQLIVGEKGSRVSFADYAIAVADELETPKHTRRRFTIGY